MAFLVPSTQGHLSFPFLSSFLPPFHLSSPSFSASFCYKISTGWTTTIVPLFRDTPCSCQGLTWEEQLTIKETISLLAIFLTIISHFYGHSNFRGEEVLHTSIYNEKKIYIYSPLTLFFYICGRCMEHNSSVWKSSIQSVTAFTR